MGEDDYRLEMQAARSVWSGLPAQRCFWKLSFKSNYLQRFGWLYCFSWKQ